MEQFRRITWLPGIVFAWALSAAILGFSTEPINSQSGMFTITVLLALGSLCGFAHEQTIWSGVAFLTPLVGISTYALVSLDARFVSAFLFVAVAFAPFLLLWFLLRFFRNSRIAWAIYVAFSIVMFVWLLSFIVIGCLIAGVCIVLFMFGIPLGVLFRMAYEFRQPTGGLPVGLIHRQFSLRSMFWVTTWFAILSAALSLEQVSLIGTIHGTLGFLIAGATMYVAVTIHYRFFQTFIPGTVDALSTDVVDALPPGNISD